MNNKILILGNKPYKNFKLNSIIDSFDIIYRFNMTIVGKNNGTKFGKLAVCNHVYSNFVDNFVSRDEMISLYGKEMETSYLDEWYDFFQQNKKNFEDIYYQSEHCSTEWNNMLSEYGSPYKFSKMASTGHSTIFTNLREKNNEIYIACFTLCPNEIRKTLGELDDFAQEKNEEKILTCHSFTEESRILAWLHNNNKVDASLCMIADTEELNIQTNEYETKPSEFIINLLKGH